MFMADDFKIGDVVQLKSGGPKMTVVRIDQSPKRIICEWFAGDKREVAGFNFGTLSKVPQDHIDEQGRISPT
jgi:uncharacterized protein YodC (DUF2158 family)